MKVISFFNCKGKIGKTTMIYHLAHKFAEKGVKVLAVDLDPQAGLTEMFGDNNTILSELCSDHHVALGSYLFHNKLDKNSSEKDCLFVFQVKENLLFIPSDSYLSIYDVDLSKEFASDSKKTESVFEITQLFINVATRNDVEIILLDLSSNCFAINKSVLATSDYIINPVPYDKYAVDSVYVTGLLMNNIISETILSLDKLDSSDKKQMKVSGYIVLQSDNFEINGSKQIQLNEQITKYYHNYVLGQSVTISKDIYYDRYSLSILKFNPSLYQMSLEAGKPMFQLTPADGAIGNHMNAVRQCNLEYDLLAESINEACQLGLKL
ncbi:MAG: ParA family protein [Bacteroidia bacterium]|jgi:cellulose biosynthesis protein BcsQ|nr:ParA family protein [Bacteroidia bacterium]